MPRIIALGDGNCAFNAFALGLCDSIVNKKIEASETSQHRILSLFTDTEILQAPATWDVLQTHLIKITSEKQFNELQEKLAKGLRKLFADIASDANGENKFSELTSNAIQAAYEAYVSNPDGQGDDIFIVHPFIKEKFEAVKKANSNLEAAKKNIEAWWANTPNVPEGATKNIEVRSGSKIFIDEMSKSGKYAGDLELGYLARYFDVGLNCRKGNAQNVISLYAPEDEHNLPTIILRHNGVNHWDYETEGQSAWLKPLKLEEMPKESPKKTSEETSNQAVASANIKHRWLDIKKLKDTVKEVGEKIKGVAKGSIEVIDAPDSAYKFSLQYKLEKDEKASEINIVKKDDEYIVSTKDTSEEQLRIMVEMVIHTAKELGMTIAVIDIDAKDKAVKEKLVKLCHDQGYSVKVDGKVEKAPPKTSLTSPQADTPSNNSMMRAG